jgi:ankyrin repeat protein
MLPLHCAATTQIAEFLIDLGAPLDARCLDHNSTALQYAVGRNDDVARLLIDRGCETDIFAAATIGIPELIESTLDSQPDAIAAVVDRNHFPSPAADCIYSWTIGWFATPHMAASKAGQEDALAALWKRSPPAIELLNACLLNDETRMKRLTSEGCAGGEAAESCQSFVAHSARNNNHVAVRNLLQCGFDPKATGQHGATALHWAAFHGNVQMLLESLKHTDDLSAKDADYDCTPLQWARQGVMAGWHKDTGDFASVAKLLLEAGSPRDDNATPTGNAEFDNVYS